MQGASKSLVRSNVNRTPHMFAAFVSGATGVVPAMTSTDMQRSRGIVSITRNSAGNYTVVLQRGCNDIAGFGGFVEQASWSIAGASRCVFVSKTLTGATPSFTFQVVTENDASTHRVIAQDPTTGDIVKFWFDPKYSTGLS